jgi:hypothetical protein
MRPLTTRMQILGQHPHVLSQELPRVLPDLHATLKPGGVLFSSNPRGSNEAVAMKKTGIVNATGSIVSLNVGAVIRQPRGC